MDFKLLLRDYPGKFVAILDDEKVVASGDTYNEVVTKVAALGLAERSELAIRLIRPPRRA